MVEFWVPVIAAGIIVGGAAAVQLGIYIHTLKERRRDRKRKRINAVKDLFWGLLMISAQGLFKDSQGTSIDPWNQFLLYPEDISWLRRHFHENAHLFSSKLHKQYREDITDMTTRPRLIKTENVPLKMQKFVLPGPVSAANLGLLCMVTMKELQSLDPDADLPNIAIYVPEMAHDATDSSGDRPA